MKFGLVGRKEEKKKELKVFDQNLKCHQKQNICANYRSVLNLTRLNLAEQKPKKSCSAFDGQVKLNKINILTICISVHLG